MHKPERAGRTPEHPGSGVQTTRPLLNEAAPMKKEKKLDDKGRPSTVKLRRRNVKRERNGNRRTRDACRPTFIARIGVRGPYNLRVDSRRCQTPDCNAIKDMLVSGDMFLSLSFTHGPSETCHNIRARCATSLSASACLVQLVGCPPQRCDCCQTYGAKLDSANGNNSTLRTIFSPDKRPSAAAKVHRNIQSSLAGENMHDLFAPADV